MADETTNEEQPVEETPADEVAAAAEAPAEDAPAEEAPAADAPEATATDEVAGDDPEPAVGEDAETTPEEEPEPLPELNIGAAVYIEGDLPELSPLVRGKIDRFGVAMGTGRRKTAVARVRIRPGDGQLEINGRPLEDFLRTERDRQMVMAPLEATEMVGKVDVWVRVKGGGTTGQTGAIVLGIARALEALDPSLHARLSEGQYLTRDERMVERKKYGLRKARRSFQFSKR